MFDRLEVVYEDDEGFDLGSGELPIPAGPVPHEKHNLGAASGFPFVQVTLFGWNRGEPHGNVVWGCRQAERTIDAFNDAVRDLRRSFRPVSRDIVPGGLEPVRQAGVHARKDIK